MKYGLPELPEEDDLTDFHREAHGKGVSEKSKALLAKCETLLSAMSGGQSQ